VPTTAAVIGAYSVVHITGFGLILPGLPFALASVAHALAASGCPPPAGLQVSDAAAAYPIWPRTAS
jgi:hypothetical protein